VGGDKYFESMVDFIYLGTILKNLDCVYAEIKSKLNSGMLAIFW
jgi:hypothetical protein